jgi:anti-sigma-K factor RskA
MVVFVARSGVSTNGRRPISRSMLNLVGVWDTRPSRNEMSNRAADVSRNHDAQDSWAIPYSGKIVSLSLNPPGSAKLILWVE